MPSTVAFTPPNQPPAAAESRQQVAPEAGEFKPFGAEGLTFGDVLDVINPLQNLPIVGFIYRAITGDTISAASKVAGGALFGGLIGFAAAVADTVLEESSGKDAGAHLMAVMRDIRGTSDENPPQPGGFREAPWNETASLRHDANEHEDGWWQDPDSATDTENVAAANHRVGPGAALDGGPRALAGALLPPQALATNSATVTAMRNGGSRNFRPGGTINTDSWLKLMSNVSANRGPYAAPTGAGGLASATLAKALATYGAAEAIAAKAGKGSARP